MAIVINGGFWRDTLDYILRTQFEYANREDVTVLFREPRRPAALRELARLPGVIAVEGYRSVPVRLRVGQRTREIPLSGLDPGDAMRRILTLEGQPLAPPISGIYLSRYFETAQGVKAGDTVELEILEGGQRRRTVTVTGFTDDMVGNAAYIQRNDLHRLMDESPVFSLAKLRVERGHVPALYARLKAFPEVAAVHVMTLLYQGFQESIAGMIQFFTWILIGFAVAIAAAVIFNSARDKYSVTAFADGDLRRVTLRVGDRVKKGDPVSRLLWDYEKELKSPVDGVVSRIHRETAGPIQRGTLILEIADTRRLEVVAEFLTSDAVRLRAGMPLRIEGWGGETPLASRVTNVSRAGYTKTSALGVEEERTDVRGDLSDTPPEILSRLGNNYHVDVTVVVSTEAAALTVPLGALFRNGADWAVYRVENQRAQTTPVILGRRNDKDALVREGLQPGDRVILYPGDHIKTGVGVRLEK